MNECNGVIITDYIVVLNIPWLVRQDHQISEYSKRKEIIGTELWIILWLEAWLDGEKTDKGYWKEVISEIGKQECSQLEAEYRRKFKDNRVIVCVKCQW